MKDIKRYTPKIEDINFDDLQDISFFDFSQFMTEEKHIEAAHDLPLIADLLATHAVLIGAAYFESKNKLRNEASTLAIQAHKAIMAFVYAMEEIAQKEYPDTNWLAGYTARFENEEYQPEVWPPRISNKEAKL